MAMKKGTWNSKALANPAMKSRDDSYSVEKLGADEAFTIDSALTNLQNGADGTIHINTLDKDVPTVERMSGDIADEATERMTADDTERNARIEADNALTATTNTLRQDLDDLGDQVSNIEEKIPGQASATNQLADKAFVNSTVQTSTANFRGNWATYAAIPTDVNLYPADYAGSKTPTVNDYLVVESDENDNHNGATWRYKYTGVWATNGKAGWQPEYRVNESPFTARQLAALNSGVTSDTVSQVATNKTDIKNLSDKESEFETTVANTYETKADAATKKSEIDTALAAKLDSATAATTYETKADATSKKTELDGKIKTNADDIDSIERKIPANASAQNQLATKADITGGLSEVVHDSTLSGKGTTSSPLSVVGGGLPAGGLSGQVLTKTDTGETWADEAGLEGDYCCRYGMVDETKSGLPTIVSGSTVKIPAQLVMDIPGVPGLTTNGSDITYEIKSTINCALFFANGEILEATDVFFQKSEPEDGTTGYAAWWNGTEWKFKSNDTGNVYRSANAVRIAKCVFTNGTLTRLCFTGCRLLNKQDYATKEQLNTGLATKADVQTVNSLSATVAGKATKASDFMTPVTSTNKGATKTQIDALDSKIDIAGTSGKIIGSYWFGKTKSDSAVPAPTLPGQNYYDFTTNQVYKSTDGATWTLDGTNVPPSDIDAQIMITSKFWDIIEQENQHGGKAWWSHTNSKWSYSPTIYEDKPAGGASLPLLTRLISDHKFNDVSYLDANTFSWQSGAVYKAVYEHLVSDFNGATKGFATYYAWQQGSNIVYTTSPTPAVGDDLYTKTGFELDFVVTGIVGSYNAATNSIETDDGRDTYIREPSADLNLSAKIETFADIEITYYLAEDGHRICLPDQETAVSNLYAKTGEANFYILDTANSQFKLPRTQKRKLIRAVKNDDNSWYNLYSDGWVEQGGLLSGEDATVVLSVPMQDTNYIIIPSWYGGKAGAFFASDQYIRNISTTGFVTNGPTNANVKQRSWFVVGRASDSVLENEPKEHEYYYVGNF